MNKYLFILLVCFPLLVNGQIEMNITNLTISQLEKEYYNKKEFIKGADTITIAVSLEHHSNSPYIEADIKIKNISDSSIVLIPNMSQLFILYRFEEKEYKNEMSFHADYINDKTVDGSIILNPKDELNLNANGYIVKMGTTLDIKFMKIQDLTKKMLEIIPTIKFEYVDENGMKFIHNNIYNVKDQYHPKKIQTQFEEIFTSPKFKEYIEDYNK